MLGSDHLTDISKEQAMTHPGMAYFAGTGPARTRCQDCKFKGYFYDGWPRSRPDGSEYTPHHRSNGCAKAYEMTGKKKPTPEFPDNTFSCKYFVGKDDAKTHNQLDKQTSNHSRIRKAGSHRATGSK